MSQKKTTADLRAELLQEMETNQQTITDLEHKQEQLKHRITKEKNTQSYLAASRRKARTHRLVVKGGVIEHHAPETKELTEREFYELMENILCEPEAQKQIAFAVEAHGRSADG